MNTCLKAVCFICCMEEHRMLNSIGLSVSRLFKESPGDWAIFIQNLLPLPCLMAISNQAMSFLAMITSHCFQNLDMVPWSALQCWLKHCLGIKPQKQRNMVYHLCATCTV
ncbi:hypothetical protein NC653_001831 [Populus alba x Populus x berolinensis]|uniref:Uncharacterized protein n=1 Tax=Populus alba x Populus x berolinensis TaxID=444605 RepID=A0AAD6RN22_9ROSI|nr:hypothetical protein NC653_001831 [Populus alba x Populus x berolinensis]